jgi:LmbE family N-acetylglucosaminyl deacetylase
MKRKILIIESHSDDSAISISGYLSKFKSDFEYNFLLITCSTITHTHTGVIDKSIRLFEYERYINALNANWWQKEKPFDADSLLDTIPKKEIISMMEHCINDIKPDKIICQGPSFHQDHIITYESLIAATRPSLIHYPNSICLTENPTYVHSLGPHTDFKPDTYISLSKRNIEDKINLCNIFKSQLNTSNNILSEEKIISWARYRGIECRKEYAEALKTFIRII